MKSYHLVSAINNAKKSLRYIEDMIYLFLYAVYYYCKIYQVPNIIYLSKLSVNWKKHDKTFVFVFWLQQQFLNIIDLIRFLLAGNPPSCVPKEKSEPINFSSATEFIYPTCITVKRCGGCCKAHQSCVAATKAKKQINVHKIGCKIFSTSYIMSVQFKTFVLEKF